MYTAQDLLNKKNNDNHAVSPDTTVAHAAKLMETFHLGAVLVVQGRKLLGIVSRQDILFRVVAKGLSPTQTPVNSIMTQHVICCSSKTGLDQVHSLMEQWQIHHIPVADEAQGWLGVIGRRDLLSWQINHCGADLAMLNDYVYGRT